MEVSLHSALIGVGAVARQCAHSDVVCKHLEIWDGVGDPGDVWGDGELVTEVQPFSPGGGTSTGPTCSGDVVLCLLSRSVVIFCLKSDGAGHSCQ